MKLPNSLSSSSSGSGGQGLTGGQGPAAILWAKPAGRLTSFIFLHLFPHRTQLPFNNTSKELEAGLQAKPFWSSLVLAAQIPGTFAVFQEPWPERAPGPKPRPGQGLLDGLIFLLGLSTPVYAAGGLHR